MRRHKLHLGQCFFLAPLSWCLSGHVFLFLSESVPSHVPNPPAVGVLLVPSPGRVPAKVTWPGVHLTAPSQEDQMVPSAHIMFHWCCSEGEISAAKHANSQLEMDARLLIYSLLDVTSGVFQPYYSRFGRGQMQMHRHGEEQLWVGFPVYTKHDLYYEIPWSFPSPVFCYRSRPDVSYTSGRLYFPRGALRHALD